MEYLAIQFEYDLQALKRDIRNLRKRPRGELTRLAVYRSLFEAQQCAHKLWPVYGLGYGGTGKELRLAAQQVLTLLPKRRSAAPVVSAIRRLAEEVLNEVQGLNRRGARSGSAGPEPLPALYIGAMRNSQVQYMSPSAVQQIRLSGETKKQLMTFIQGVQGLLKQVALDRADKTEVHAQVESIRGQTRSSKPQVPFIQNCLIEIRQLVQASPANLSRDEFLDMIDRALRLVLRER